jgi:predicted MPP superfamily phosphohydrolase
MKAAILDIYWRLSQYPWHVLFNVGIAGAFYALSLWMNLVGRIAPGCPGTMRFRLLVEHPLFRLTGDLVAGYTIISILVVLFSLPFLLNNGIAFNVLGYTFYYWFFFFPVHLAVLSAAMPVSPAWRIFASITSAALLTVAGLSLFYFPFTFRTRSVAIHTKHVRQAFRIVQLADLQAERYGRREKELVARVNAASPDLVLISGDLFSRPLEYNRAGFQASLRVLEELKARHGICFVEGHHDQGAAAAILGATRSQARFLRDAWFDVAAEGVAVSIFGASLDGRDQGFGHRKRDNAFTIYLAHGPVAPDGIPSGTCDLALFGHTHAGQVYLPVVSRLLCGAYRYGAFDIDGMKLIVNAGVGTEGHLSPRIRWFTWPEIVIIDLLATEG